MRLLIASSISPDAIQELSAQHDVKCAFNAPESELKTLVRDRDAIILRSGVTISAAVMKCAPNLKLLIRAGSGFDNIDIDYVRKNNIILHRIPEPGAKAVAEMAFALMLALARNMLTADQKLRQGRWIKHELKGYLLTGKTLGIVGAGNIGSRVGQLGAAWGMKVVGCNEHPSPAIAARLLSMGIELCDFDTVIKRADFLSLHVPLTPHTRGLIDAEVLNRMKPGSFLINLARGGVVDEHALCQAIQSGDRLRGAALDVHANEGDGKISPLASLPNVILTPHIGSQTVDTQREIGRRIIDYVEAFEQSQTARLADPDDSGRQTQSLGEFEHEEFAFANDHEHAVAI